MTGLNDPAPLHGASLRPLTIEDAVTIAGWAVDPRFCRAADWTVGLPPHEYLEFQTGLIAEPPTDLLRLGVALDERLIGYVALQGNEVGRRELGFVIGERALWGRGLGTAAASAGLHHGFVAMSLRQIWAEALDANRASVRILEHLGMQETGVGEQGTYLRQPSHYRQFTISRADLIPQ
ncbi:MAG: GNAT family N-acetyltransferase [Terracoccus sp.]